jgi:type I restriction enzyme, S subunit
MASEVPSGWRKVRVSDVLESRRNSISTDELASHDVLYFSIPEFDETGSPRVTQGSEIGSSKYEVPHDCVLLSRLNPRISRIWRVQHSGELIAACSTEFWPLIPKTARISLDFVKCFLESREFRADPRIAPASSTRSHQRIKRKAFEKFSFVLPPLSEQKKIATILTSVDEAIEATEEAIEQTRRVKKGLLQELVTRGVGHTEFQETAIGEIPKGWEVRKLGDVLAEPTRNGYSPVCLEEPTGKWVLGLGALTPDGLDMREVKAAPPGNPKVDNALLEEGDVLVSRSNTIERVGYAAVYQGDLPNCSYPDLMIRARPDATVLLPRFLNAHLWTTYARRYFQGAAAGTSGSMVKITGSVLRNIRVPLPSLAEQHQIVERLDHLETVVTRSRDVLREMQRTKQGLLQDLLTGTVRVNVDAAADEVRQAAEALAE